VSLVPFSTPVNDEFSPVYYKNGVVFCSNLKNNSLINIEDEGENLFNIFYVTRKDSTHWSFAKLLSNELTTNYNDGPATFSITGDTVYYCRNNNVSPNPKHVTGNSNTLGIYSAVLIDGKWSKIKRFDYNNPEYSILTPTLSPDEKRLYFASDMPGGYGGTDLYYCKWTGTNWDTPKNLGPVINTPGNESYPFASKSGKLFFASDGIPGFGGKDLFYSQNINDKWISPVHLDAGINSPFDDFGLITDANLEYGFFSSNRENNDDIYSFTANPVQFPICDSLAKNNYCYLFYDEFQTRNDSVPVIYEWNFGNGIKKYGVQVDYCFPGTGRYEVWLNLLDAVHTDSIVSRTSYKFELEEAGQLYFNSPDVAIVNEPVLFDGENTKISDYKTNGYWWDFGEGFIIKGPLTSKTFMQKGEYTIKLGLLGKSDKPVNDTMVCLSKKMKIFENYSSLARQQATEISNLWNIYFLPGIQDSCKSVSMDNQNDIVKRSNGLRVKIYLLDNLSELKKKKIVDNLYEIKNSRIDINDTGIDTLSNLVLTKIVDVFKEIPDLKLEIAVYTEEQRSSKHNIETSENWANEIYTWFLNHGISQETLHFDGFESKASGAAGKDKQDNNPYRWIEFIILNQQDN